MEKHIYILKLPFRGTINEIDFVYLYRIIIGVVTLGSIMSHVFGSRIQPETLVKEVMYKQLRKVNLKL